MRHKHDAVVQRGRIFAILRRDRVLLLEPVRGCLSTGRSPVQAAKLRANLPGQSAGSSYRGARGDGLSSSVTNRHPHPHGAAGKTPSAGLLRR